MGGERTQSVESDVSAAKRRAPDLARSATRLPAPAGLLLSLQQIAGNRAVRDLVQRSRTPRRRAMGMKGYRAVVDLVGGRARLPVGPGLVGPPIARSAGLPAARSAIPAPATRVVQRKHVLRKDVPKAIEALKRLPKLTIESRLGEKDDAFWERYMRRENHPVSLASVVGSMLAVLGDAEKRGKIAIVLYSEGAGSAKEKESRGIRFVIDAETRPSGGDKRPFTFTHVFGREGPQLTMYIQTVVAPGRGRALFHKGLLPLYDSLGVTKVALRATGIGGTQEGVFAWARYGFVPTQPYWDEMRKWGLEQLPARRAVPQVAADPLKKILLDGSPKALRAMVHLSWEHRGDVQTFVNDILASTVGWDGEIDLTDNDSREWIKKYSRADDWKTFGHLLPGAQSSGGSKKLAKT